MTREELLKQWEIVDYRIPRKGDMFLGCDNHCNYSIRKATSNYKFLFATIVKKKQKSS
jgi:hypothetical protein